MTFGKPQIADGRGGTIRVSRSGRAVSRRGARRTPALPWPTSRPISTTPARCGCNRGRRSAANSATGATGQGRHDLLDLVRLDSLDQPRVDTNSSRSSPTRTAVSSSARVPPVPVSVRVYLGPWEDEGFRSGPSVPLDLKPGQQVELDLGGSGAIVKGKVKLTGKVPADLDCTYSLNYLVRRTPGIAPPPSIAKLGFDIRKGWQSTWHKTQEGQAYLNTLQHWFVKLAPDGTFRISGVPPGEYDLAIEVYAKPSGCLVDPLAQKVVRVTVTAADAARGELTMPEIPAEVVPVPMVGDTPSFSFQRADGSRRLAGRFPRPVHGRAFLGELVRAVQAATSRRCDNCKNESPPAGWPCSACRSTTTRPSGRRRLKRLDLPWQQGRLAASQRCRRFQRARLLAARSGRQDRRQGLRSRRTCHSCRKTV